MGRLSVAQYMLSPSVYVVEWVWGCVGVVGWVWGCVGVGLGWDTRRATWNLRHLLACNGGKFLLLRPYTPTCLHRSLALNNIGGAARYALDAYKNAIELHV